MNVGYETSHRYYDSNKENIFYLAYKEKQKECAELSDKLERARKEKDELYQLFMESVERRNDGKE